MSAIPTYPTWVKVAVGIVAYVVVGLLIVPWAGVRADGLEGFDATPTEAIGHEGMQVIFWPLVLLIRVVVETVLFLGRLAS